MEIVVVALINHVAKNLSYMISNIKYLSDMKVEIIHLNHLKDNIEAIMELFEHNNLHIPSSAPSWLQKVKDINVEVENFPSDVGGYNLIAKQKYGKKAFKIMECIRHLIYEAHRINWSDHKFVQNVSMKASTSEPSLDHHDSKVPTPSGQDDLQSRKQTSTEAPTALELDDKSHMVSLCGIGGLGNITMMENEKKVIIEKEKKSNLIIKFDNFVMDMNEKIVQLNHIREDVEHRMMRNRSSDLEIPSRIHYWLKDVGNINALVESLPSDVGIYRLKSRHKLGKKSLEIIEDIKRLIDEESMIKWTNIPLGKVVSVNASTSTPSSHHNDFESRKRTFMEALKALEQNHKSHMVALCGVGGVGKTTMVEKLIKVVTKKKIFDVIIEVIVGERTNIIAIQQIVAAYLGLDLTRHKETRSNELGKRFKAYSSEGKKFLIVLDDVREFVNLTDIGLSPLPDQGVNFKILMTARDQNVCSAMKVDVDSILNVNVLTDLEAQYLFLHLARDSKDDDVDLRNIGDKIAIKCLCIPATIKTVACTLRGQRKEVWEDSLSRLNHQQPHDEVVDGVFEIIYDNLKEETRSTLLLCGLFHKDLDTPKEDLVRYAWGLNLFRNVYTIQEARNRLNKNIEELKLANLLIKSQDVGCVMMDDPVRSFVLRMYSKGEHASVVGDMSKWPTEDTSEFSKRISLTCTGMSVFPRNCKYPNLLLLKLIHGHGLLQFHDDFYQQMRKLEVLVYEDMRCPLTFGSLGCSTNLRTLCFHRCSRMFDLSPIGDLFNLEVLSFVDCHVGKLPSTIGKLKNLKLLEWRGNNDPCIKNGVLKKLVKLEELYIRKYLKWNVMDKKVNNLTMVNVDELATCSKNLVALEIEFLDNKALPKGMSFKHLRRFKISLGCSLEEEDWKNGHSLENKLMLVTNNGHLVDSGLYELFKKTKVLHLQVDDIRDGLVNSYPHQSSFTNMRVLTIVKCVKLRYLFTVPMANGLTKLERLKVSSCLVLETLLESDDSAVEDIKFQELKFLSLDELPKLTSICNNVNKIELPQLEELILESLPNFTSMQPFLNKKIVITQLKKMRICKMENLKELWPSNGGEVSSSSLKEIEVEGCQSLVNLFPVNPMSSFFYHLEEVKVTNCDSIDVLFNIELGCVGETKTCNSKLKYIKLLDLINLREIWMVKGVNASNHFIMGFEALESIEIFRCKSLDGVLPPNALKFDMRALKKVIIDDDDDWLRKKQMKGKRLEEIADTNVFRNQSRVFKADQVSQFEGTSSKYTGGSSGNAQHHHHMRDASSYEPTNTEDFESKSSYGNRSMEVEVLKEKSVKYEKDRDEVEWKHKAELDAQRKETIDQLAQQLPLSDQFSDFMKQFSTFMEQCSAFMTQFQSTNLPPPPPPSAW